jgi:hypothetical protein
VFVTSSSLIAVRSFVPDRIGASFTGLIVMLIVSESVSVPPLPVLPWSLRST